MLQVVSASTTTPTTIATTTFTDTGITATITPTASNSKILVFVNGFVYYKRSSAAQAAAYKLLRGATVIQSGDTEGVGRLEVLTATYVELGHNFAIHYLDSPATTSATTYKLQAQISSTSSSGTSTWNSYPSNITLMEIGA